MRTRKQNRLERALWLFGDKVLLAGLIAYATTCFNRVTEEMKLQELARSERLRAAAAASLELTRRSTDAVNGHLASLGKHFAELDARFHEMEDDDTNIMSRCMTRDSEPAFARCFRIGVPFGTLRQPPLWASKNPADVWITPRLRAALGDYERLITAYERTIDQFPGCLSRFTDPFMTMDNCSGDVAVARRVVFDAYDTLQRAFDADAERAESPASGGSAFVEAGAFTNGPSIDAPDGKPDASEMLSRLLELR